jgi:hypothetical protein
LTFGSFKNGAGDIALDSPKDCCNHLPITQKTTHMQGQLPEMASIYSDTSTYMGTSNRGKT